MPKQRLEMHMHIVKGFFPVTHTATALKWLEVQEPVRQVATWEVLCEGVGRCWPAREDDLKFRLADEWLPALM